ncbi:MAG: hypothetical protein JWO05_3546 [Gemmatimonadetes bacterium]|nr:hypothetical protein [Gemmatimonadota bacterium]
MTVRRSRLLLGVLVSSLGSATSAAHAQPAVRFEVGFYKPLAVFHYLRQLAPKARANPYKTQFAASRFATPSNLALLDSVSSIQTDYEYSYPSYADGKIEGNTIYILKRNLVLASSLDDFRTRSIVVLPSGDLNRLTSALVALTPVYDSLVYLPSRENFERQMHEIQAELEAKRGAALFDDIRKFYRASWDPSVPFIFAFYPRPAGGGFSATAYGNVSESELPADMKSYSVMLSLMMHEAAHILLDEQHRDAGLEMQRWYDENSATTSRYARGLMQESWATAVGNGYLHEKLTGALNPGSWYGQKYISAMAKQLLPLMRPYLDAGKPMDRVLVDAYVNVFERDFQGWLSEWEFLMLGRAVISERPADFDLIDRKFPYRNAQKYLADFSDESLRALRDARSSKMIVISRDNAAMLERVRHVFPELAGWHPDLSTDFTRVTTTADKTRLIVVNLVSGNLEAQLSASLRPMP